MNILLTGATGFIGRNFIEVFEKKKNKGDKLIIVVQKGYLQISNYQIIEHECHRIKKEQFKDTNIDVVIHLGGSVPTSSKDISIDDALRFTENIASTVNLISELPNIPNKFIYASSVTVYEDTKDILQEDCVTNPTHMYGLSKLYIEKLLTTWAKSNNVTLQILRIGQVYGAGEESQLIIPKLIDAAIQNQKFTIYSDGQERRSFIHVMDVCKAIWRAIRLEENFTINVASATSYSITELAEIVMSIESKKNLVEILGKDIKTRNFIYDCTKMIELLGREEQNFLVGITEEYMSRKSKNDKQ